MKEQPLVSVGLPIYNRPEGLQRTLECFINQTYSNIEIIIADNCSPNPEVEKIAREYVAKDARISYFRHDENKGWGYNTNFVIEKAKGDYFLRATDDDWWDITFIDKIMDDMLRDSSIVLGFSNFVAINEAGIVATHYPDFHLSMSQFTGNNQYENLKNYIQQFEGFGKSNLYFSIFKTEILRSTFVHDTLEKQVLAGDLMINFYTLLKGKFSLNEEILFKVTYGNEKFYDMDNQASKTIDLFFLVVDVLKFNYLKNKWSPYLKSLYRIIDESTLRKMLKIRLKLVVFKKIVGFNFDTICISHRTRKLDVFKLLKRKYYLE